jgi:hypothetical protein
MIVASDNSPLQYLVLVDCDHVLPLLYGQVLTTPQVIAELLADETPDRVRAWATTPPAWLQIESPRSVAYLDTLDRGEASAISLAVEKNAELILIDERDGARTARSAGLRVIGTLGLLMEAGLEQAIDFHDRLNELTERTSFYSSPQLIEAIRRQYDQRQAARDRPKRRDRSRDEGHER